MKKGIIWLSSYPKCGNTYVRIFLSHYIYSEKEELEFKLLNKIPKFEHKETFSKALHNIDLNRNFIYYKHCIDVQQKLINRFHQKDLIYKTHHFFGKINGYDFTNEQNTLMFIYLIRDPREVAVSYASHSGISIEEQIEMFIGEDKINRVGYETKVNWMLSYKSWKSFKSVPSIFIKYEDLINDPINFFSSIVYLLSRYTDIDYDLDKIKKVLQIIEFNNLKKLEEKNGFTESMSGPFFRSGKINTWKDILNKNQIIKIENKFGEVMKELGYL